MAELRTSISKIILLHDCVIIPDLGGFVANYKPAQLDKLAHRFMAPSREIVFNSKLSKNDGLLINWIVEEEGIGYLDAKNKVAAFVEETLHLLENGETVEFENIGNIRYDKSHNLLFEPQQHENLLTDSFGLDNIFFPELSMREALNPKPVSLPKREAVKVQFNKRRIKQLTVALPLLFALCTIPVKNSKIAKSEMSSILPEITMTRNVEPAIEMPKITLADAVRDLQEAKLIAVKKNEVIEEKNFHVIVGSFKREVNADKYKRELLQEGHQPKVFKLTNGYFRVSIDSYITEREALSAARKLQENNSGLSAWVLKD